jgi:AcrR family transcriptional regulator
LKLLWGFFGVAEVTLFRHFASKEKLFEAVISHYSALPGLKSFLPRALDMSYEDALAGMAELYLDTLVHLRDWIKIMHSEIQRSSDKLLTIYHSFLDEIFEVFADYFRELQQRYILRDFDPEFGARAFQRHEDERGADLIDGSGYFHRSIPMPS